VAADSKAVAGGRKACSTTVIAMTVRATTLCAMFAVFLFAGTTGLRAWLPDVQRPSEPARIISLIPAATEMLFAIGAGPRVVAVSSYDRFPPDVTKLPSV
jgi:ABC-type hemin transport system substrate-binding protein